MSLPQYEWNQITPWYRTPWAGSNPNFDIRANDPGLVSFLGNATPGEGRPCRWITLGSAGTVTVTGHDGVNVTFTGIAGQTIYCQAIALVTGGTCNNLSVFW